MPVKKSIVIKIYTLYLNLTLAHTYLRTFSKNDIVHSWHFRWYEIWDWASLNSKSMNGIQLRGQGRNEINLPCVGKHIFFSMLKMFSIDSWATFKPISNCGSWAARTRPSERRSWWNNDNDNKEDHPKPSEIKRQPAMELSIYFFWGFWHLPFYLTAGNKMNDFFMVV